MTLKVLLRSGWLHALCIAVIIYPLSAIIQKFVASYTDGNLLAYTGIFTLSSSCALLIMAGPGELGVRTLRRPETWCYAILQIVSYLLFLFSLKYISATEGATLAMMGGLFVLILSFLFLDQKLNKYEILGGLIMLLGFCLVIKNIPLNLEAKSILTAIVVIRGVVICGQKMITEIHKTNKKAKDFKSQVRVVGFIMSVASFVFLSFLVILAMIKSNHAIDFLKPFPEFVDFLNFKVWCVAIILGFFVVSASKYCEFYSGKTIGARYLTSITSLQIIFIYSLEFILSKFNILEPRMLSYNLVIALILVILGNILIALAGFFKDFKFVKNEVNIFKYKKN